jgi:FixJ family two-component response regulator
VSQAPMIAIVDDDEAVRSSIANLIRSLGFGADPFASGEELLRSHRLDDTCCVITDMQMPGMTGLELQGLLLAQRHMMPIIFITAYPEERTRRHAIAAGAVGFFSKPFDGAGLIHCIEKALTEPCRNKSKPSH